ncbi:MarR family winged helix-turn-helix transcriptional regulator [Luteipulveratus halotolerans]|uniref:HTH marR-type domain-containing protein n=1 Tax=Luteipulveratus halotolerans TaxID=1631356 RepID=A0A0L6CM81_9MICO|nr:MarR family winged helix-turn-helix transcriptional regulator [Luteipulveratus halotolerans]KNX38839.1 hypothetical protein VV01_19595 [Luteipulveratus halotolerans]
MSDGERVCDRHPVSNAIFVVARAHRAMMACLLRDLGLHPGQEILLMELWDHDGRSQRQLGEALAVDHSTIAKSVRRLEDAGLVTRARSAQDGRVTVVTLTDAGRALEQRVEQAWAELDRRTTEGMTSEDQTAFVELATAIERRVRDRGDSCSPSPEA